jgi:NADPH-dependent glutamate synthase beta subunit-like oxidoreductase
VGIKRSGKKKKKLGSLRSSGSSGSATEQSPRRPKFVEKDPPCQMGCPQGTDIRGILTKIAAGEKQEVDRKETWNEVFQMLSAKNPLPAICGRVCPHPCETECNRNEVDTPASINNVERFVGDWAIENGLSFKKPETIYDESVAVIGSGPAGLSTAYHLALKGYKVTIHEAFPKAGGLLRYGIPAYRLPREIIDGEVQRIVDLGVELKLDTVVGKDISLADLRAANKAVFVGIGAHKGRLLGIPGEDAEGMWTGTSFLNSVNSGAEVDVGKRVLVIGGGDTAIDAARMSRRFGAEATIVYRRTRDEMPAIDEEIEGAEEEGVDLHFLAAPIEILTENGKCTGMRCQVCELGEPDDSGRRRPVPVEGEEFTIEADTIVAAISQDPEFEGFENMIEGRDWIKVDEGGETKEGMVFSGGDNVNLGLVTIAIAQGRLAADTIHAKLRGLEPAKSEDQPIIKSDKMALTYYEKLLRSECGSIAVEDRFQDPDAEIESGLTEEQAIAEAQRCMSCGSCFDCGTCWSYCQDSAIIKPLQAGEPYKFKLEFCKGCDKCAEQCPCGYIEMYDPTTTAG